ncbi:hypothetical protein ABW19_dt0200824 [Dactylella cylindrospora]|nr:hypothetical protein ABW19_dt0200824 [Dactylella cylindrospora]
MAGSSGIGYFSLPLELRLQILEDGLEYPVSFTFRNKRDMQGYLSMKAGNQDAEDAEGVPAEEMTEEVTGEIAKDTPENTVEEDAEETAESVSNLVISEPSPGDADYEDDESSDAGYHNYYRSSESGDRDDDPCPVSCEIARIPSKFLVISRQFTIDVHAADNKIRQNMETVLRMHISHFETIQAAFKDDDPNLRLPETQRMMQICLRSRFIFASNAAQTIRTIRSLPKWMRTCTKYILVGRAATDCRTWSALSVWSNGGSNTWTQFSSYLMQFFRLKTLAYDISFEDRFAKWAIYEACKMMQLGYLYSLEIISEFRWEGHDDCPYIYRLNTPPSSEAGDHGRFNSDDENDYEKRRNDLVISVRKTDSDFAQDYEGGDEEENRKFKKPEEDCVEQTEENTNNVRRITNEELLDRGVLTYYAAPYSSRIEIQEKSAWEITAKASASTIASCTHTSPCPDEFIV